MHSAWHNWCLSGDIKCFVFLHYILTSSRNSPVTTRCLTTMGIATWSFFCTMATTSFGSYQITLGCNRLPQAVSCQQCILIFKPVFPHLLKKHSKTELLWVRRLETAPPQLHHLWKVIIFFYGLFMSFFITFISNLSKAKWLLQDNLQ